MDGSDDEVDRGAAEVGAETEYMSRELPGFIRKTWFILSRPEHAKLISWSDTGDAIVIHDVRCIVFGSDISEPSPLT